MKEYKKQSADDLMKLLDEKREAIRASRFDMAGSSKKNVKASGAMRKEIARILTELNLRKDTVAEVTA